MCVSLACIVNIDGACILQMPAAPAMAGSGFMSNLNPLSLMTGATGFTDKVSFTAAVRISASAGCSTAASKQQLLLQHTGAVAAVAAAGPASVLVNG
jgi:hypothetical protein